MTAVYAWAAAAVLVAAGWTLGRATARAHIAALEATIDDLHRRHATRRHPSSRDFRRLHVVEDNPAGVYDHEHDPAWEDPA